MNKPILAIAILCSFIFLTILAKKGHLKSFRNNLIPTSCRSLTVKLKRRIPKNWSIICEGNNLAVSIQYIKHKTLTAHTLKKFIYREIANNLIYIAKNSPSDNLERTTIIRLRYTHPKIIINAVTEGKYLVKLATLKSKKLILDHIKATVQIQETAK